MSKPRRRIIRGKVLAELRIAFESNVGTLGLLATAYGLTRANLQKIGKRNGWKHSRPRGRPVGWMPSSEAIVCRHDRRPISLRTIMLEALEGRA